MLVYVIQMEADRFDVARDIDPAYDAAFAAARAAGVESYAYACRVTPDEITIARGSGDRPQASLTAWPWRSPAIAP